MKLLLGITGLVVFAAGAAGWLIVRIFLRPDADELDEYYWEFEDRHPRYAAYQKWSGIAFGAAAAGLLLLFAAASI
jgi:hypothetical protein